jgi:hypothetical protein
MRNVTTRHKTPRKRATERKREMKHMKMMFIIVHAPPLKDESATTSTRAFYSFSFLDRKTALNFSSGVAR